MARSGNGIDLGAVYALLTQISARMGGVESKLNELVATVNEHSRKFDEVAEELNAHGGKFDDLSGRLTDLYDAVGHYHHSVVGHGMAVNRLEERVTALEEHLGLEPSG